MPEHHLIIGGGPAATNAMESIRSAAADANITLISDEPAHSRMALPYWLAGKIPKEQTYTADENYFQQKGVTGHIGLRAEEILAAQNQVRLVGGETVAYDKLLIATGSRPVKPPIQGIELPFVQTLWSITDTERVLQLAAEKESPKVVLIGAGFIGFIVLGAMFKRGWDLTVVEREAQVLPRMLDQNSATHASRWLEKCGVKVHTSAEVTSIEADQRVKLASGECLAADIVIVATGIQANLELAKSADLATDQGILVNDKMQTSISNIYAAGDVAQGPVLGSSAQEVHAIQPTAVDQGRVAGANMAGADVSYPGSLLMNVVDICGLQTASYGQWDAADAEAFTISSDVNFVYRKLLWDDDKLIGAIFTGRASDVGMLTDLGMVKGFLQTQTSLGEWKAYLSENPYDIRRAYIATGVAQKLMKQQLLGKPSAERTYRYDASEVTSQAGPGHAVYVQSLQEAENEN